MLNSTQAIQQMNVWGAAGQPFYFIINFDATQTQLSTSFDQGELHFAFHQSLSHQKPQHTIELSSSPADLVKYQQQFERVVSNINYGNSFLVNLTQKTPIDCNLSLKQIYTISKAKYKVLLEEQFVCFSPETFIQTHKGNIYSHPMKGTIRADIDGAAAAILNDPKETAEHITIVDLIRNDLSMVASNITVDRFRYLDRIETQKGALLQVSSEIRGQLKTHWQADLGNIIFKLLPAGSISGAPKPQTLDIIKNSENYKRGYYTGICGYFDGEELDTGVMIRFIEQENGRLYFKSGGGITAFSNLESEYQEMIDKIYVPIH